MHAIDLSSEIEFQTTRSGGKGGQNVNKVETAVIGSLAIDSSGLLNSDQKALLKEKLFNRISTGGLLQVKSQTYRSQLENKGEVIRRINFLVGEALKRKKLRIATKAGRAVKEKRIESKKIQSDRKSGRKKFRPGDY